ncbi:MAG: acetate--CoA ligase family protein [Acidimicrobiia bacterium]|nr:acetate--CoA ligase family protein [Actinomycetota bacterium]MBL6924648.1 acetate--CoA ligase family protein [Acidimicrobiia bacterium]MBL6926751.1 acetate--CoA ligase family protein [Acidimicrobiia bacterium]
MGTLSESESRRVVAAAGVLVSDWGVASDPESASIEARGLGFPVAVKLCGTGIAHKTERGLVRLTLTSAHEVELAGAELLAAATPEDGEVELIISSMVSGNRELIAGLVWDDSFGPCVMLGVGGVLAEAVADVAFRLAPLDRLDAHELIGDLDAQALLGPFRGEPTVDREALVDTLCALGSLALDETIRSIDLNPLIISDGRAVAVDALVELADQT